MELRILEQDASSTLHMCWRVWEREREEESKGKEMGIDVSTQEEGYEQNMGLST